MATKKETSEAEAINGTEIINKKSNEIVSAESIYSVKELADNAAKVFGPNIRSECVMAALRSKGKDTSTVIEAKKIINEFIKKEVK